MSNKTLEADGTDTILRLHLQPRASTAGVKHLNNGELRLSVTAPAVDNAANKAAVEYLAKLFKISKMSVILASGQRSRQKTFRLRNLPTQDVSRILDMNTTNK